MLAGLGFGRILAGVPGHGIGIPFRGAVGVVAAVLGDKRLPETRVVDAVEHLHGILGGTDIAELAVAGDVALHAGQVLVNRREAQVHLVAEAPPGVAVVRELGRQDHFGHLLVGPVGLGVIPKLLEVGAQRVGLYHLVAIPYDRCQVGIFIGGVPRVVQLGSAEQVGLGQEVGRSRLGEPAQLVVLGLFGQQAVRPLKVGYYLCEAFLLGVARVGVVYLAVARLELERNATKLLYQLKVGVGPEEVALAQAPAILVAALAVVALHVLYQYVGRLYGSVHVVPQRLVRRRLSRVQV